jgi:glutaredoxin 3
VLPEQAAIAPYAAQAARPAEGRVRVRPRAGPPFASRRGPVRQGTLARHELTMARVTLYTTRFCPYCSMAKRLLGEKGVAYEEIDVGGNAALRQEMTRKANGRRSVPQIWIGETHVGGCSELYQLEATGKLDALLAG